MNICLFLSTETLDLASALIRAKTQCDWSHVGFYDQDTNLTFSAMDDGKGVDYRPVTKYQKVMLLSCPNIDEIYAQAVKQKGKRYDELDIVGIALDLNLHQQGCLICDVLVFKAAQDAGYPLLNRTFIPLWHLTPRDVLLADLKQIGDIFTGPR